MEMIRDILALGFMHGYQDRDNLYDDMFATWEMCDFINDKFKSSDPRAEMNNTAAHNILNHTEEGAMARDKWKAKTLKEQQDGLKYYLIDREKFRKERGPRELEDRERQITVFFPADPTQSGRLGVLSQKWQDQLREIQQRVRQRQQAQQAQPAQPAQPTQ